jgi:hypothetical protein
MLEIEKKTFIFKNKEIWFADSPYDIKGYDSASFMSCRRKSDLAGFVLEEFPTLVQDLTQNTEFLWLKLAASCKKQINRALREGITCNINEKYDEFYEINKTFRQKKGLAGIAVTPEYMKKYGILITATHKNEVISGLFLFGDSNNLRGLYAASKRLDVTQEMAQKVGYSNKLLWWEAMKYGKEKGIKEFDFGGYYTGEDKNDPRVNINAFKLSYGGHLVIKYNYNKVYSLKCKWARSLNSWIHKKKVQVK